MIRVLRSLVLTSFLFAFWLILSGIYTPFLVLSGLGASVAVTWFCRRLGTLDEESMPLHVLRAAPGYWLWLAGEIVRSALDVSRIVLHPRLPISPTLVRFRPSQRSELGMVIHANSITLTPGTLTIECEPDEFLVHALTSEGAFGVTDSVMDARARAMEGKA